MPTEYDPADCFADILDNVARIERYTAGLDREAVFADPMRHDAVERCLARICEAAARMRDRSDDLAPDQPWRAIRNLGNRIRHAYDRLDEGVLWDTIRTDLPSLKAASERALARLRAGRGGGA